MPTGRSMEVHNRAINEDHAPYSSYHRLAENGPWWRSFAAALQASDYGGSFCDFWQNLTLCFV